MHLRDAKEEGGKKTRGGWGVCAHIGHRDIQRKARWTAAEVEG